MTKNFAPTRARRTGNYLESERIAASYWRDRLLGVAGCCGENRGAQRLGAGTLRRSS